MEKNRSIKHFLNIIIGLFLAGCAGAPSTLAPASTSALEITRLIWTVFSVAAVVFIIVEGLLIFAVLKFRHKDGGILSKKDLPNQIEGHTLLETAWTSAPAVVLAILFVLSIPVLQSVLTQPTPPANPGGKSDSIRIQVVAHQFWWEFKYPGLDIVTANEYHVPSITDVSIAVESADVIHSYWVPQLGGKIDVIPGRMNFTWFNAPKTGEFKGQCAEFCGDQHGEMRFLVVVEPVEKFQAWVKQQQALPPVMTGEAAEGEEVFMKGACISCHTVRGTVAKGLIGPDLTHFASRQILAGGIMNNSGEELGKWLANTQGIKPGAKMPSMDLLPDQITALVAYLQNLK